MVVYLNFADQPTVAFRTKLFQTAKCRPTHVNPVTAAALPSLLTPATTINLDIVPLATAICNIKELNF
ncbi:hypothetical protein CUMW_229930 [Citrus unshiu]|nr:hypothetical protein CUMW_229930 [Citrus unshiu]